MKKISIFCIFFITLMLIYGCSSNNSKKDLKKLISNSKIEKVVKELSITSNLLLLKNYNNQDLLNIAIDRNSPELVQILIQNGLKFDSSQVKDDNPLNKAIKNKNMTIVLMLLNSKSEKKVITEDIESLWNMFITDKDILQLKLNGSIENDKEKAYPIFNSLKNRDLESLKSLLKNGANPNIIDVNGKTPLIIACELGNYEAAKALINAGVDINAQDDNGDTALIKAVAKGNILIIILLLNNDAQTAIKNNNNIDANIMANFLNNEQIAKLFKGTNNNPRIEGINGKNNPVKTTSNELQNVKRKVQNKKILDKKEKAIIDTSLESIKDPKIMRQISASNGDLNARDKLGLTPLMMAAGNDDEEIITLLLINKSDPQLVDLDGNNILMIASQHNYPNIIRLIYSLRFDINAKNKYNQTALMIAVLNNNLEVVKELIKLGADVNAANSYKQPALIFAAYQNNTEIVTSLLKAGAQKELKDIYGYTALDWAKYRGNNEVQSLLN